MRRIDLGVNNSVNGPIGDALIRAYRYRRGYLTKADACFLREAYLRIERGETNLEMEVERLREGVSPLI